MFFYLKKPAEYMENNVLILYPTKGEAKHVRIKTELLDRVAEIVCGVGKPTETVVEEISEMLPDYDYVILFGCCGGDLDLFKLYSPVQIQYKEELKNTGLAIAEKINLSGTADSHVSNRNGFECWPFVDRESYFYAELCDSLGKPFTVVRYMVDRFGRKLAPKPFNFFVRKLQHYVCQKKFGRLVNRWMRFED